MKSPIHAVMERVRITDSGCWEWQLAKTWYGYGRWNYRGKVGTAHRITYELLVGPIPEGVELDHLCRNRACVNPTHLEPVTHKVNMERSSTATKSHCKSGHEFTEENTYRNARGNRQCRQCRRDYHARHRPTPKDRTVCKRGHLRTAENGYYRENGWAGKGTWHCDVCSRDDANARNRAKGVPTRESKRLSATHCPHGHEYTAENTYWYERDGRTYRYCRECNREAARRRKQTA